MSRRVSVKLSLLSTSLFLLACGVGGGDSYRSEVRNQYDINHRGGVEVSEDRKRVRIYGSVPCKGQYNSYTGNWVDVRREGVSEFTVQCGNTQDRYVFEVRNGRLRISVNGFPGGWIPLCPYGNGSSISGNYRVDVSNGYIRFCFYGNRWWNQTGWICGYWVSYSCEFSCPPGYTYNPSRNVCEADPSYLCPQGYDYNTSTGKCERSPEISYTCPLDPNQPCINDGSGYYCSSNQCYDAQTTPTEVTDTPQGINDIPADGQVTDQGCMGTIYVFNGRDMRCRPPGTQTGLYDCCVLKKTWFGLGNCKPEEQYLSEMLYEVKMVGPFPVVKERKPNNCYYVGEYCAEWWPFKLKWMCVQKKKTYCCFSSPLAKIIHEQGRPQLGIGWGTPKAPNCRGFTPEEFQKLDFSKMDFSEWIESEVKGKIVPEVEQNISNIVEQLPSQIESDVQ